MLDNILTAKRASYLLVSCGVIGLFGCFAVLATDLIGIIVVENYNPMRESISDLAAGSYNWIQDAGMQLFAVGLLAIAVGMVAWNLGGTKWKASAGLLALLALDIAVMAAHNEYGDRQPGGTEIHFYLVVFLGIAFALIMALAAFGLARVHTSLKHVSLGLAVIWIVFAPLFFVVPDAVAGAYERLIAMIMVAWVAGLSWLLIQHGRGRLSAA